MNEYVVTINNKKYFVKLFFDGKVEINGKLIDSNILQINDHTILLRFNNKSFEISKNKIENGKYGFTIAGWYFDATARTQLQETANELMLKKEKTNHEVELKTPMPGLVLKINKQKGDAVKAGEPLLILEAMKMENELRSTTTGTIIEVYVKEGESVEKGSIILKIK